VGVRNWELEVGSGKWEVGSGSWGVKIEIMKLDKIMWLAFVVLVAVAIIFNGDEHPFISSSPYPAGKYIAWLAFLSFSGYSYHCGI